MGLVLKYHPNPYVLTVRVDRRLTDGYESHFSCPNDRKKLQPRFVRELFMIVGVKSISIMQYEIEVIVGQLFDLEEMTPQILEVLKSLSIEGFSVPKSKFRQLVCIFKTAFDFSN